MNLGVFLAIGESLTDLAKKGQVERLLNYNIQAYSEAFDNVYIFSYANEKNFKLPKNCYLIPNTSRLHRYIYTITLPLIKREQIINCDILRGLQLSGGIPASVAKIIYGKKFVINYGYDYSKFAKIEKKTIQSFIYKLIKVPVTQLADAIIVTSQEIKKDLAKKRNKVFLRIKKSKIHFIPNGVDIKLFRRIKIRESQKFTVIFIGRLEKQKNLENLTIALSQFKDIKAIFYGQGSLKKSLKFQANKLKVNLTINSPIDYQKIPQTLSLGDVFVLPSLEEGNPKILLEAMACQKGVIGSNVKGINEIIINDYNGVLTDTDPQSIAEAIKKLTNKSLREKLGENARKYIVENYEINRLMSNEVDLLKKVGSKNDK